MPVRRVPRERWGPFVAAVALALERRGFPYLEDYKTDFRDGFGAVPMNCLPDRRVSAAMAYLTGEVRSRSNLTIRAGARVQKLSVERTRVNGVFADVDGESKLVRGGEVIVSCGALQSPALLMRSGIGPADHLATLGIEAVCDLPGVGANLHNHPAMRLSVYAPRGAAQQPENIPFLQSWMRYSSNHRGCPTSDMHLIVLNKMAWHDLGRHVGNLAVTALKSYSRGRVELASADPTTPPRVSFALLDDERDYERLVDGFRFVLELATDPEVTEIAGPAFNPNFRIADNLEKRTRWNGLKARALAAGLDVGPLRSLFLRDRVDVERLLGDESALRACVRRFSAPQLHPLGTCRMGTADDPEAVVDGVGRVHGIEGLRVVDASIFPTITRGYTHFLVLMAAEKLADAVKSGRRPGVPAAKPRAEVSIEGSH
jgi:5-(hydroxymethyl)furfural/furfural oxidase